MKKIKWRRGLSEIEGVRSENFEKKVRKIGKGVGYNGENGK